MRRSLAVTCVMLVLAGLGMIVYAFRLPASPVTASSQPVAVSPSSVPQVREATSSPVATKKLSASATSKPKVHAPATPVMPMWLSISSVKISESIVPMGLARTGEIEPPPGQTIWYTGSPQPGVPGISILVGHVEFGAPDTFWRLNEVPAGALVTIRYSNGTSLRFVVTHVRSELKTAAENDPEIWGASKSPKLVLVTCDKNSLVVNHHHLNNFLVFATPV